MFKKGSTARILRPDLFSMEARDDVTVLRFRHHDLVGADLERLRQLWRFLSYESRHPSKVLLIEVPAGLLDPRNADRFLERLQQRAASTVSARLDLVEGIHREENFLSRFIERVSSLDTFVIVTLQGEIDLPFLGAALACDYRIVSDDTVFVNRVLARGLPAFGALTRSMIRFLGYGAVARTLWGEESIPAEKARRLGLVNEVNPLPGFEKRARRSADRFAQKPRSRLVAMKRLLNADRMSWDAYRRVEQREVNRCLTSL